MPDISLESFCSYMEEIGFVDIDLLSDFLESYNNYKKKPLQEALFITMIKFFRDNYIHNEDNLNRLCKRLIESYNKSLAVKKADSIKKLSLIINNKQNIFKSIFFTKLKSRNQIENIMRRYVKGYSRDKIRRRKMSRSNSNICSPQRDLSDETQSCNNYSYSNYSANNNFSKNLCTSNKYLKHNHEGTFNNNYNTITSSVCNNTSGSNMRSNFYNTDKSINKNSSKINITMTNDKKNLRKAENENNSAANVFDRLNNQIKISTKKSLNNSVHDFIPSRELKEIKELEQCTFQPKINYYYPSCSNANSKHYNTVTAKTEEDEYENVHEKLFREQVRIKEKKNIKSLEKMISESKVLTFQPYISPISRVLAKNSRSRSLNKILNRSVDYNEKNRNHVADKNIFLRNMEKLKQASEKSKMTDYIKRQKELNREYTYSPSINKNYKSKNSGRCNSPNQFNDDGSYDFSYLNYNAIKSSNSSPKNSEKLPVFSRVTVYSSNANAYPDYVVRKENAERNHSSSNFKRSRSKAKARNKSNDSGNISVNKSRKNSPNFKQLNNKNSNINFKKSNYAQEELLENEDFDVSDIPHAHEKRSQSFNDFSSKAKSVNLKNEQANENHRSGGARIDNNINLILKQNINKNRSENNNDYHFNYNFKKENLYSDEGGYNENLNEENNHKNLNNYIETNQNQSEGKEVFDKLYNEAEKLKVKKMILTNELYSEKHGLTFKPKINNVSKYCISTDFYTRDMNFVKTKRENLEKLMKENKQKELASIIRKSRTLSKEEKERNTRSVVERLYKKQIEKLKENEAKKIEEEKKMEAELKKRKKSKEEIQLNNKNIVHRLYAAQIEKIKEEINVSKKLNDEESRRNLEIVENQNLNKIKQSNKKKYSTVQSRVFNASNNNNNKSNNNNVKSKNNSVSPSNNRNDSKSQSKNLLKKLKKEHQIKFKNEDFSSVSKSKEKNFNYLKEKDASETRIKKTEDSSPNKNSIIKENSKNAFNFIDSINSNTNRNSLLQSNSSVGEKLKKSNSKVIKPIRASDFNKKNYCSNSDYLLDSNNIYFKKSDSRNSNEKNNNNNINFDSASNLDINKNLTKKNSLVKDYANLSPIINSNSLLEINALSDKSSFRDGEGVIQNGNNTTNYNNSNTKETSVTNNSKTNNNKSDFGNFKEQNENLIAGHSDNSDNSRGIDIKENKFKSKGLEKILSGRK